MSGPVPIKIIRPSGQEIEVAGVRYVQIPYDKPYPSGGHPYYWCVAGNNLSLCDVLCPYCHERMVFTRKMEKR